MLMLIFTLLFVINVITFFVYAADKHKEVCEQDRISKSLMMSLAVLGGSYGAGMAMLLFKSVNDVKKIRVAVPICLVILLSAVVVWKLLAE